MEAIKFMKELKRYCDATSCEDCEAGYACNGIPAHLEDVDILESIEFIEKWSNEHPRETRQSEFLKLYPTATLNEEDIICILPCQLYKELHKGCESCKYEDAEGGCEKAYWLEEIDND